MIKGYMLWFSLFCAYLLFCGSEGARGGRGRGKGKGKNILPFGNIAEYSLVSGEPENPLVGDLHLLLLCK